MKETSQYINQQNSLRRLWEENDTPEHISAYITHEAGELEEAIRESLVTGDVFSVASEIGDVGYLLLKLCDLIGIDLKDAINMKIARNDYKYPAHIMSNGRNYDEAVGVTKEVWEAMGGDSQFSQIYLQYLAEDV